MAELIHFQGYIQGSIWFSYKESLDSVEIGPVKGTGYWPKRVTLVVFAPDPKGRKGYDASIRDAKGCECNTSPHKKRS